MGEKEALAGGKDTSRHNEACQVTTFRSADVKSVCAKFKASQADFPLMLRVSVAALRDWEQGRRIPDGLALALLRVAARNPSAVGRGTASQTEQRRSVVQSRGRRDEI